MSETKNRNKWSLPMEPHTQMIWKRVNSNMESLLKQQNTEVTKPKADREQLLNDLPELLNDLARICRENTLLNRMLWMWGKTTQVIYTQWQDLNSQLAVQKDHHRVFISIVLWKYPFNSLTGKRRWADSFQGICNTPKLSWLRLHCHSF